VALFEALHKLEVINKRRKEMCRFADVHRNGAKQAHVSGGPSVGPSEPILHGCLDLKTYQMAVASEVPQSLQPTALSKARTLAASPPGD
jgi:hypothetical protein